MRQKLSSLNSFLCKKFTWEELSKHNKSDDAYVAIRGNVYDITNFIKYHPGGEDILLFAAGRDATQAFETYHELGKPDLILKKHFVGILTSNELPIFPEPSEFHRTVKKRVEEYFRKNKIDPKNKSSIWIRYANIFITLFASYYAQFYLQYVVERIWLQILFAIVFGFASAQIGLNQLHDASHFSADPDFRRIKPSQRWYSRYINQHVFVPFLYGLLAFKVRIQDIIIVYILKSNDNIRINPLTTSHTLIFWGGKAFFILYRIIIPLLLLPVWKVLILFVIADMITSYWLSLTFQANHVVEEVEWPLPDKNKFIEKDWAEMQIVTTQDYAHDSYFWTTMVGSLNYQAVHHIFPQVSQHHYHDIAPIVKETYYVADNIKFPVWTGFHPGKVAEAVNSVQKIGN
nr:1819_t:CDS:10 [Entrophospora candida]